MKIGATDTELPSGGVITTESQIRDQMNHIFEKVLRILFRLSLVKESEDAYMSPQKYTDLLYSNFVFDIAKLYDIIGIYGKSNPAVVKQIVVSVFDNDKRYIGDFKQGVDGILSMLRKSFSSCIKVSDMIAGNGVVQRTRTEQDNIIKKLMLDLIEIMINIEHTTNFFPDAMLETVRTTSLPIYLANVYALMINTVKTEWMKDSLIGKELNTIRK
jgi:hypothetical protein